MKIQAVCAALLMSVSCACFAGDEVEVLPPEDSHEGEPPAENVGQRDVGSSVIIFSVAPGPNSSTSEANGFFAWLGLDADALSERE